MFGPEFYPTPREVIEEMISGFTPVNKVILEPSAGKGNIVDYLKGAGASDVIACELQPELRKILGTKCNVIENDFFNLKSDRISHIHAIIMNPPFSTADKHILHAWEIAPPGCRIISLCNSETVRNHYTNNRQQLLSLIEEHGSIMSLGNCFKEAERLTNVEVSSVTLNKPGAGYEAEFDGFFLDSDEPELEANAIMPYNFVRDLVNRYVNAVKLFDKQLELAVKMNDLTDSFYSSKIAFSCHEKGKLKLRNDYLKDLQKNAWDYVFRKMNMQKHATKGLREDINRFVEQQQQIPFTMKNIYRMIEIVIGTTSQRMDKALIEVFDKLTQHYHENRYNVEGWKTNSHYLMNERFIMPWLTEIGWSGQVSVRWNGDREVLDDFVKALCYITGTNYDNTMDFMAFVDRNKCRFGDLYSWGFFEFRAYKKGTVHFKFQDRDVWAKFNQHISRIKGFPLPESIRK